MEALGIEQILLENETESDTFDGAGTLQHTTLSTATGLTTTSDTTCVTPSTQISTRPGLSSLNFLTIEVVNQACMELLSDQCMPSEVHHMCSKIDKLVLFPLLQFLDACLVPKGRFKNNIKEKAWAKFYQATSSPNEMQRLDEAVTAEVSMWLCFKTFEIMIKVNYDLDTIPVSVPISSSDCIPREEEHIVNYIGGSVIHRLKQRAFRLKETDVQSVMLDCLKVLCSDEEADVDTLTGTLDRGGLVKLTPSSTLLFLGLEKTFRAMFTGFSQTTMPFDSYFEQCCALDSVSTRFYEQVYSVQSEEICKEKLLRDIIHLYFRVRVHHKCKTYMDTFRQETKKSKKEKGLRKQLKQNKGPVQ